MQQNKLHGTIPPPLTPPHKGEGGRQRLGIPLPHVGRGKGWGYLVACVAKEAAK